MRKQLISKRTIRILDELGVEVGTQKEIQDLEPPIIGAITKNEEIVAVTEEGVTQESA